MDTDELNDLIRRLNREGASLPLLPSDPDPEAGVPAAGAPSRLPAEGPPAVVAGNAREEASGRAGTEAVGRRLASLLATLVDLDGTDLLLVPGAPPTVRVHGELTRLSDDPLQPRDAAGMLSAFLNPHRRRRLDEDGAVDFAFTVAGVGRFRVNLHRAREGSGAALRRLPEKIPPLDELGLPPALAPLTRRARGLLLVTGPTGSGKTTTLAALVDALNRSVRRHVVTIEDPVEYQHAHGQCLVEQVEVGTDAPSFARALVSALRQDPDVILVGEMRDLDTVGTALTAAETGHLVLATLHTNDAPQTVHRIVDVFPSAQQDQVRQQLSLALTGILSQQLVPRRDGSGRALACELLIANDAVRSHLRRGTLHHLHQELTLGRRIGMVPMEASLARLVRAGVIERGEAEARASHPDELSVFLDGA